MKRRLKYALLRPFSKKHALKYRAAKEAVEWMRDGFNYQELWRYHTIYIKETQSIYIAISKSANSAIRRALSDSTFYESFNPERNARYGIYQYNSLGKTLSDISTEKIPVFTVVRHPTERFWSAYQNKVMDNPDYGLAADVLEFHGKPIEQTDQVSPGMVLDYMEQSPADKVDEHLRPQWACCGLGRISFQMIAKVESLQADMGAAVKQGLFPHDALARLTVSNKSKTKMEDEVREKLRTRVENFYARDFQEFGYQRG